MVIIISGNRREDWKFFEQLDAILGIRTSSAPVLLQCGEIAVTIQSQEIDQDS